MTQDQATRQRAPQGLGKAGAALWRQLAGIYKLMPQELALLELACRQADDIAHLEELVVRDGLVVPGSNRQPRLNAAVIECRQGRLALAKIMAQLSLPDEEEAQPMTAASRRAQKAAQARWSRTRRLADRQAAVLHEVAGGDA